MTLSGALELRHDESRRTQEVWSGTTLAQMICALVILQDPEAVGVLDERSPWVDMQTRSTEELYALVEAQTHRRFLKTHTPLDGLPWDEQVTYLCVARDPRDVALSWDNHMANLDFDAFFAARARAVGLDDLPELMPDGPPPAPPPAEADRFWAWVETDPPPGSPFACLATTIHHLSTFWTARARPNVVLLHYGELTGDLEGSMRGLAERLGIAVPASRWPELVAAAGFDRMKARAAELAPVAAARIWRDPSQFFRRGTTGQWRDLLDAAGARRYAARVATLGPADLLDWAHAGPSWR